MEEEIQLYEVGLMRFVHMTYDPGDQSVTMQIGHDFPALSLEGIEQFRFDSLIVLLLYCNVDVSTAIMLWQTFIVPEDYIFAFLVKQTEQCFEKC